MADVPAYICARFSIEDPTEYRKYEKGFFPLLKKHGGEFITFDDGVILLEGELPPGRTVLFRFPSEAAARAWYADPDYQALAEHRWASTKLAFLSLVHGMPARG